MPRRLLKMLKEPHLPWKNLMLINNHNLKLSTLPIKSLTVKNTPLIKMYLTNYLELSIHILMLTITY